MSGTASRYIGGVPYGPAMGVGRYNPRAVSPGASLPVDTGAGTVTIPRGGAAATDGVGIAVDPRAGTVTPVGGGGGGMGGMGNLLLAAGLGLLPYLPDAVNWVGNQLGGTPAEAATPGGVTQEPLPPIDPTPQDLPMPPDLAPPPEIPGAVPYGTSDIYGQIWGVPAPGQPGLTAIYDSQGRSLGSIDMMYGADDFGDLGGFDPGDLGGGGSPAPDGFGQMGATPGEFASVSAPAAEATGAYAIPASANTYFGGALDLGAGYDFGMTGSLGSAPMIGDIATGAANLAGGYLGRLASQGTVNERNENSGYGHTIGSTIGGILGSFIPVPVLGSFVGATLGGVAGAGIGDQVGAPPTIGTNFGATGTFNPDGTLSFGGFGGDNGGTAQRAQGFADWFGSNLLQQAGQQGLQFNPNMAGVQFNVGGFDNFSRSGDTPGGFFFDPMMGASPENYALRPGGFSSAFSPQQANEFTTAVLADLAARDVFTAGGQGRGRDFYNQTLGAPLDWYSYGGEGSAAPGTFGDILAQRQGTIGGWLGEQQARAAAENAARAQLAQNNRWGGFDTSGISATNLLAAQGDPTLAANLGLGGVQATENGFVYAVPGGGATFEPGWTTGGG